MRGPASRNFSTSGDKTLVRLPGGPACLTRIAVCEAAVDAMSLAAIERVRREMLYAATAGGMRPATLADPNVEVQVGTMKTKARARTSTGEERARLWETSLEF